MIDIIDNGDEKFIMDVSPIYSEDVIDSILMTNTTLTEIIVTLEAIYDRLGLDGDDALEYKEKHKEYYMRQIMWIKLQVMIC